MSQISFEDLVNGSVPDASDFNSRLNALKNRINNGMESDNIADASITTAKLNNDAVTLAKLAHGTLGGVPYYGASGAPAELAGNTTATRSVLTQTGDGTNSAAPIWSDISASAAEVTTGTEAAKYVAPSTVKFHSGVAKAWAIFNGSGTPAIIASYNVDSSITDNGTCDYTLSWTTDFSSGDYAIVGMTQQHTDGAGYFVCISTDAAPAAGTLRVEVEAHDSTQGTDMTKICIVAFGDQ